MKVSIHVTGDRRHDEEACRLRDRLVMLLKGETEWLAHELDASVVEKNAETGSFGNTVYFHEAEFGLAVNPLPENVDAEAVGF